MLTQVRLVNYRCFKEATVRMSPLTVIVGPNAAGKSSFLEALLPLTNRGPDFRQQIPVNDYLVEHSFLAGPKGFARIGMDGEYRISNQIFSQLMHFDLAFLRQPNQLQSGCCASG